MDNTNIFESVSKDESLPLAELLQQKEAEKKETENVTNNEENLTPLQKMKLEKEKTGGGMILTNEELKKGAEKIPSSDMVHTEAREEEFKEAIDAQDEIAKKRAAITLVHQPKTNEEYILMMDEIDSVSFDENGVASINYQTFNGEVKEPYFIRLRKDGDPLFDEETIKRENPGVQSANSNTEETTEESENTEEVSVEDEEKKKIVQVLIDKTGFGSDFMFTDEEKEKLVEADVIKINEVKTIDLATIKTKRSDKSFQDLIKEHSSMGSRTTICFPASGFRAQMKGLSYGEYADISLSMDNVSFDKFYKRLSIIYNKMVNISTGPFKDFEDFLKHFAYTDIYLAIYALFVATEQENKEILLKCGNKSCDKSFNWKYGTRSVLRLDGCADTFLNKMKEIAEADAIMFDSIRENAAVNVSKTIKLPDSGFIVELGIASAYDFLYNFIPLLNEETFHDAFGDDNNEIYMNNIILLTTVRSVYVPDEDGEYIKCEGYKDILDAIYNISPTEIKILTAYTVKIQNEYEVSFAFVDVKCPHCGNITKKLDISVDDLVFQTYQQLLNTSIDLENIQGF